MACSRPEAAIHVTRYKMNKIPNEDVTVVLEPMAETDILAETTRMRMQRTSRQRLRQRRRIV